jgi:peptidoglycan/xylan/chitin deacetylase (PgdA/CDA1 family)
MIIRRGLEALAPTIVHRLSDGRDAVALTFDDGPSRWTELILDVLANHGASATFFVVGSLVAGREEVLRRAIAESHELGNHLFSHVDVRRLGARAIAAELRATSAVVAAATGVRPRLVRPPFGAAPQRVQRVAGPLGMGPAIMWDTNPHDWERDDAEEIAHALLAAVRPGSIVLLHDGLTPEQRADRSSRATVDAVDIVLTALRERGLRTVTVSQGIAA